MWPNGQSVRCVQARCGGLLSDLEVGWNPWTSLVVRHSGTAARGGRRGGSDYGTAEVLVRVLGCRVATHRRWGAAAGFLRRRFGFAFSYVVAT